MSENDRAPNDAIDPSMRRMALFEYQKMQLDLDRMNLSEPAVRDKVLEKMQWCASILGLTEEDVRADARAAREHRECAERLEASPDIIRLRELEQSNPRLFGGIMEN